MPANTITLDLKGAEDTVTLDDMGDGYMILSQQGDDGEPVQIGLSWDQLLGAVEALRPRYGDMKNTDRELEAA